MAADWKFPLRCGTDCGCFYMYQRNDELCHLKVGSRRKVKNQELFSYGCGKCELPNDLLFKKKKKFFLHILFLTICVHIMHIPYRLSL